MIQASRVELPGLEEVDNAWRVGATHCAGLGVASRIQSMLTGNDGLTVHSLKAELFY